MKIVNLPKHDSTLRFIINNENASYFIPVTDIVYCKACRNYCYLHVINGKKYLLSKTLSQVMQQLEGYGFVRIHKSHIVNMLHIRGLVITERSALILSNDEVLEISRRRRKYVKSRISEMELL